MSDALASAHVLDRAERGIRGQHALLVQLVREHVEQHFGVGFGVDVAAVLLEHLATQGVGVDQVAVVRQRDAVRRIHVERLRFVAAFAARRGIAAMADADAALQQRHLARAEGIAHEAVALHDAQLGAVGGGDAGGVLSAML